MFFSDALPIKKSRFHFTERRDFFMKDVKINVLPNMPLHLLIKRGCRCGCRRANRQFFYAAPLGL